MTTFINIHALISHPSSMMNRDDSGLQKTAVFGGTTRSRISSQCLKRAIRQSDLYKENVEEVSVRTRLVDELIEKLATKISDFYPEDIKSVVEALSMNPKTEGLESNIKTEEIEVDEINEDGTKVKVKTGEVKRVFKTVQPFSTGEIRELMLVAKNSFPEVFNEILAGLPEKPKKSDKTKFKKSLVAFHELINSVIPVLDVALSGRMDTSCYNRNTEASMSVAHSLTTHSADIEVDWFTACDDLAEQGSGHIGTNEFSSGVFYRYASIDIDLLANSINKSISETTGIVLGVVKCFAQVTPSAKQKTFAAYNFAEFVMAEKSTQPISLVNAFRNPIPNTGKVMEESIKSLVSHYEKLVDGYELQSQAKAFDLTQTAVSDKITFVNKVSELTF
ncbi:type I-E CRISPR-associated protein Cas7/Cse4/CasC [Shewanella algicola]|uniref:Type I-E CRISPR-associated protein Cas7/Cse4/CasC n=1 Tax=Shewanella algicola TaxID=640633 RepID=A0A9X1ZC96_9GAMM|nr:type I-E CRISPR-associated protein Cas7/Cse4/CasC [Shewanella algicola]MCL1105875.1 type I-E CRISPR-associated protein Cas7/Cse4/CasC [Shewanella algicola]GGP56000.1 type I-E CRISPR-associated protein Cas7/Cse4/CasC [Shewanella algicola]